MKEKDAGIVKKMWILQNNLWKYGSVHIVLTFQIILYGKIHGKSVLNIKCVLHFHFSLELA
jgi:hypothetical protein